VLYLQKNQSKFFQPARYGFLTNEKYLVHGISYCLGDLTHLPRYASGQILSPKEREEAIGFNFALIYGTEFIYIEVLTLLIFRK
jgi:hypothetical protein